MGEFKFECLETYGSSPEAWYRGNPLAQAIHARKYPTIRALLKKEELPLAAEEAYNLCQIAIQSDCTAQTVRRILEAGPSAQQFSAETVFFGDRCIERLERTAAQFDRCDVLRVLMEWDTTGWPLTHEVAETAVKYGGVACTCFITGMDGIDWAGRSNLRQLWGLLGMDPRVDLCLRRVAPHVTGLPFSPEGPIPMPEFLTPELALMQGNWDLAERICWERGVDRKQGVTAVRRMMFCCDEMEEGVLARLLNCLFEACPELLRANRPRYLLAAAMTTGSEEECRLLRPHLEAMPGKRIPMFADGIMEPCIHWNGDDGMLARWDERLGPEYYPVLQRSEGLPSSFFLMEGGRQRWNRDLEQLLARSRVTGKGGERRPSRLAREILNHASPLLVARQMEPGGVLRGESAAVMLEYCADHSLFDCRAAILAWEERKVDYEL